MRNEEWKYTNSAPILQYNYTPLLSMGYKNLDKAALANYLIKDLNSSLMVFVNGNFSKELSSVHPDSRGMEISSLAAVYSSNPEFIEKHFSKYIKITDGFTAMNTAFVNDGAVIRIPDNTIVEEPIQLLFLSGDNTNYVLSQPHNLVYVGKNSQVKIIENYHSLFAQPYLMNSVTEIVMEEYSVVDYYKIQDEANSAYHVNRTQVHQERSSNFTCTTISIGGELIRNDLNSVFADEYCECEYLGFYLADGKRHIDNHTLIDHAKPLCHSNELYKGVLTDKSRGVFNGKVIVRPDAQKTLAYQSNKNLLLSKHAKIDTKPQLEIFANDVKCSHGATVGQLDEQSVFYLQSRGISKETAIPLLINAFAGDIIDLIKIEQLRNALYNKIMDKLAVLSIQEHQG
jgi:Fe-S cluster assembly protein SufD